MRNSGIGGSKMKTNWKKVLIEGHLEGEGEIQNIPQRKKRIKGNKTLKMMISSMTEKMQRVRRKKPKLKTIVIMKILNTK